MANLAKISIGKDTKKRNHFDLTHTNTTTFSIGSTQPLFCKELTPNTEISVSLDSFVRLAPMVSPTFGKLSMRTYSSFVPMEDIYHPWASFLAEKTYNGANGAYIPTQVPHVQLGLLWQAVLSLGATYSIWQGTADSTPLDQVQFNTKDVTLLENISLTDNTTIVNAFNEFYGYTYSQPGNLCLLNVDANNNTYIKRAEYSRQDGLVDIAKDPTVTPEGADVVFTLDVTLSGKSKRLWFCFKLNDAAARVRKILIGLGYSFNPFDNTRVSLLPLLAYYKAWFDLFMPQRDMVTWENTDIYRAIEFIELHDMVSDAFIIDPNDVLSVDSNLKELFMFDALIVPLANTFYTDNTDYVSAHRDTLETYTQDAMLNAIEGPTFISKGDLDNVPSIKKDLNTYPITRVGLEILNKLTKYVNKNSVIGGKIDNYLRSHYDSAYLDDTDTNYIGSTNIDIQIGDVYATSDTVQGDTGANLGEYAGKGVGYGSSNKLHYTAKTFGYWITMAVIVPQVSYVQALNRNNTHLSKFDFFSEEFDAIGMQVDNFNKIQGTKSVSTSGNVEHYAFGYMPRYSEYKNQMSVLNGDMSLRSTKDTFEGYYLDRIISEDDVRIVPSSATNRYDTLALIDNSSVTPMASTEWKYVGKYDWLGNYNRIFVDNGFGTEDRRKLDVYGSSYFFKAPKKDDNFIAHNVINVDVFAPMLSMKDSYDTDAQDSGLDVELQ